MRFGDWTDLLGRAIGLRRPPKVDAEAWITPTTPRWDYVPPTTGHYEVRRFTTDKPPDVCGWETVDSIGAALDAFVLRHLPRDDQWALVIDEHCNIVLGWIHKHGKLSWTGCEHAFHLLAMAHNPVDAAIWERMALKEPPSSSFGMELTYV